MGNTEPVLSVEKASILTEEFGIDMLDLTTKHTIRITPVSPDEVRNVGFRSTVRTQAAAKVLSAVLGTNVTVEPEKMDLSRQKWRTLYVAKLSGGRLPEGATRLPEGFSYSFFRVDKV